MTNKWNTLFIFTTFAITIFSDSINSTPLSKRNPLSAGNAGGLVEGSTVGNIASPGTFSQIAPLEAVNTAIQQSEKIANAELQQQLGSGGQSVTSEIKRQIYDTLAQTLNTNELYEGLVDGGDLLDDSTDSSSFERRQIYDTLAQTLNTNDLYDGLVNGGDSFDDSESEGIFDKRSTSSELVNSVTEDLTDCSETSVDAKKRSPLAIGGFAPSALGGTSETSPLVQLGDVLKKKKTRSPLGVGGFAPSFLGGKSQTAPLVQLGNILKRHKTKRSPLLIGGFAPSALGGSSTTSPLVSTGDIIKKKKRDPLSANLPVLSSLEGLLNGQAAGGENPLSEVASLLKREPLSANLPVLSSLGGLLNGQSAGGEDPLSEITSLLKREPLSANLPVLSSLEGLLNGQSAGGEDPLSEITSLLKREPLSANLPVLSSLEGLLNGQQGGNNLGELGGLSELTNILKKRQTEILDQSGLLSQVSQSENLLTDNLENTLSNVNIKREI